MPENPSCSSLKADKQDDWQCFRDEEKEEAKEKEVKEKEETKEYVLVVCARYLCV